MVVERKAILPVCVLFALVAGCHTGSGDEAEAKQDQVGSVSSALVHDDSPGQVTTPGNANVAGGSSQDDTRGQPPAPAFPEGLTLVNSGPLFRLDITTEVMVQQVLGSLDQVQAALSSPDGRRRMEFVDASSGEVEVLARADWHLMPVGASSSKGDTLVCYNRLPGETTQLTAGLMPDPTQGVDLHCRHFDGRLWSDEERIATQVKAAWLKSVTYTPHGFRVVYSADEGWFYDDQAHHAAWAQMYRGGEYMEPVFVRWENTFKQ